MDKSSSAKCLLYSDVVKGEQEEDEEAMTKKASKELEIFVSQIFYNFFLFISFFFNYVTFITFFLYFFYPRHLATLYVNCYRTLIT